MIGILVPDSKVVKSFLRRHRFERSAENGGTFLSNKLHDVVVVSGAIGEKSYEVALNLVENYSPDFIISVGFASSLKDEVPIGTVILCEKLISLSGPMALWSNESAKSLDVPICRPLQSLFDNLDHKGRTFIKDGLVSAPEIVSNEKMKSWFGKELGSAVMDREGALVAEACSKTGVPFALIRGVTSARSSTISTFNQKLEIVGQPVAFRLLLSPDKLPALLAFRFRRRKAVRKLNQVVSRIHSLSLP